jgi:predicted DNA-binding transcriptional regulator YafY
MTLRTPETRSRINPRDYQRLMKLCVEIQRGHYPNKAKLAAVIECSQRTVQRELTRLRDEFEAPLAFHREHNGFYFTDPEYELPKLQLTEGELIAFFAAERILRRLGNATAEVKLSRRALSKLAAFLPDEVKVDVGALEAAITFAPEPTADVSPDILRQLTAAATHRETLEIEYFSPYKNERSFRQINVLLVHNWMGEWYAISWDIEKQAYRDFHAGRIANLARTRRTFAPPPDWNPQEYLKKGFGMFRGGNGVTVEVEFDAFQARYARERQFHETEKRKELKDGRLRLTFETTEAALEQVARWLLQYGEHVVAKRPEKLRTMLRERLEKTLQLYREGEQ